MAAADNEHATPSGVGLVLRDPLPWNDQQHVLRTAEDLGYLAVFVPEIAAREAFSTLTAFASTTSRILLGTGVVTMGSRSPVTTAMAAATVQTWSDGRLVPGIGTGSRPPVSRPIASLREYVRVVRAVLAGQAVESDAFAVERFELSMEPPPSPPIWLGALGDRMLSLAGEIADGVILNWCTTERVRTAKQVVRDAAERAGRDPSDVRIGVYVRACLGADADAALSALKRATGEYASIPHYARQFDAMGLGSDARAAAMALAEGRPQDVPASLVREVTVVEPANARRRLADYREAGADLVLCYPVAALDPFSSILGTVMAAAPAPPPG